MTFNEIKDQIINNCSLIYPKQLIINNINTINNYYNIDMSFLEIKQIGQIIKKELNPICSCGKLKKWNRSNIYKTCGDNDCETQSRNNNTDYNKVVLTREQTCLERHGVKNYAKTSESKRRIKQTRLERYGENKTSKKDNYNTILLQTPINNFSDLKNIIIHNNSPIYPKQLIIDNIDLINNHYHIDLSSLKTKQIGQIIKKDLNPICLCGNLKTWDSSILQLTCGDNDCRTKNRQETIMLKYGFENAAQIEEFKEKIKKAKSEKHKKTCLERYGVENYSLTEEFGEKRKNSCLKKYNLYNNSQKHLKNLENFNKEFIESNFVVNNKLNYNLCMKYFNYQYKRFNVLLTNMGVQFNNISYAETEINNYIQSLTTSQIIANDRTIIKPVELDLYLPNHDLAIEYNGLYWHSYGLNNIAQRQSDKHFQTYRHVEKTNQFEKLSENHQMFHIFENEWNNAIKQDIWKSMIKDKFKLNQRVYARDTIIKEVSSEEANKFIFENHIQGIRNATIRLGLYKDNQLLSIMTFGKPLNKTNQIEYEYELIRFCNKKYTTVVGGASKLLKHFEKTYKPKSLLSYANRRWSRGNLYHKLGFELQSISKPNKFVFHINDNNQQLYNRISFQKHKLEDKLETYNSTIGADENIINNNYRIIWDCGNYVFAKTYEYKE